MPLKQITESFTDDTVRATLRGGHVESGRVSSVFSSSLHIMCTYIGSGLSKLVGWSLVVGTDKETRWKYGGNPYSLAVPRTCSFCHHYWSAPCSAESIFCKTILYCGSQDGFSCHRMISHVIQDVPLYYVFCGNIPVWFWQQRMYFTPLLHALGTIYDAMVFMFRLWTAATIWWQHVKSLPIFWPISSGFIFTICPATVVVVFQAWQMPVWFKELMK